ncbi:MAG: BMP family ABC transporter substrate-binding protein [Lachnospiraceae bacterium]|nr:BMP family ABC transporter substrate-binding protein [Lachnospiraceae bacterium]
MALEDYKKAVRLGKKDYQARMMRGERPTLAVLDEILPQESLSQVSLGLVQIPIDQIVGTRYGGRGSSFAGNFMPILDVGSEFASKWANLSTAHVEEGIHDPIKAWEYRNRFYVEEGNKRVSVMKYYEAVSIPGTVTRILPKRTDDLETVIYYEFVDFYALSGINYIEFSKKGSYAKLQAAVGKASDETWDDDDRLNFSSVYTRFTAAYQAKGGGRLSIKPGDAFLTFVTLYGYDKVSDITTDEMKTLIAKAWEEFELLTEADKVALKMDPAPEKKPLLSRLLPTGKPKLKIAFIYDKTPGSSAWTYSHELGRLHLEQTFPDEVSTVAYSQITAETIEETLDAAIADGCNLIFTTTPVFARASVKAAIANPDVRILNCSLNTSHRYIRTYYPRMHEAKFLMGAIAGAMAENSRLAYIADYPLFGTISNINAFALGAKMINPRAKVYLEWSSKKDVDISDRLRKLNPSCISGKDMVIPEEASRFFGIYHMVDGRPQNLAMPLCHWGRFYEKLIRTIMDGTWKYDDDTGKAINYWWGMSSGVVDVICSQNLPIGTKRLVDLLKNTISAGEFNPFSGTLYSQTGIVKSQAEWGDSLTPEQIVKMDWLAENVIGAIPEEYELTEHAKPVVAQQGVKKSEV